MSELKGFIESTFVDIRKRVEEEYEHQLKSHFDNVSMKLDSTKFTPNYGDISAKTKVPKALPGRWWIHSANSHPCPYNGYTLYIYDNFGQPFIYKVNAYAATEEYAQHSQKEDPIYQYPLPNIFIDFVKKQGILTDLNTIADMYHQLLYVYAL